MGYKLNEGQVGKSRSSSGRPLKYQENSQILMEA